MQEIWKDIKGYEGIYKINNYGVVYSYKSKRNIKGSKTLKGYILISLCKNNEIKREYIHRLVAKTFLDEKTDKTQINHIDGNKTNNKVDNLEWCNNSENQKHKYTVLKGNRQGKKVIRVEDNKVFKSAMDASKFMKLSKNAISNCCKGYVQKAGGYHWQYV